MSYTPTETAPLRDIPTVGCTPPSYKAAGDRSHACIDVGAENWNSGKLGFHAESAPPGDVLRRKEIELEAGHRCLFSDGQLFRLFSPSPPHVVSGEKGNRNQRANTVWTVCAIRKHTYMFNFALDRSYEPQLHLLPCLVNI